MQTLFLQGPSATLRMIILVVLSIVLMTVDHRWSHLEIVRSTLMNLLYPIQYVIDLPIRLYYWGDETLSTHQTLLDENRHLRDMQLQSRVQLQKLDILEKENERLRALLSATPETSEDFLIAEIVAVDVDPYRQFIVINKGSKDGVYRGQPIIDSQGVMGQTIHVSSLNSTAVLVTDASHAIPVQVDRTGLRSILFGTGQIDNLELRHIPHNADIRTGDKLISSGLGGHFPPNYPVAVITRVEREPGETFVSVRAEALAQLDTTREVLLVWHKKSPKQEPLADTDTDTDSDVDVDAGAGAAEPAGDTADAE